MRNEDILAAFLGSTEYYQLQAKGRSNTLDWIDRTYQDVVGRKPTADDVTYWSNTLN
jgi:hypothetical protein